MNRLLRNQGEERRSVWFRFASLRLQRGDRLLLYDRPAVRYKPFAAVVMTMVQQQQFCGSAAQVGACCYPRPAVDGWAFGSPTTRAAGRALAGEWLSASARQKIQVQIRNGRHGPRPNDARGMALPMPSLPQTHSPAAANELPRDSSMVFEDKAKGICCYRTAAGEVTCEGFDEGPHFQPAARCHERTIAKDVFVYKRVKEETWCEGKDES